MQRQAGSVSPVYQYGQLPWDGNAGLSFSPTRLYDAGVGRWLSRDPIGEAGGINLYGYVGGSPTLGVDPEGLQADEFPNPIIKGIELLFGGAGAAVDYLINNPPQFPSIFPAQPKPSPSPSPTASPTTGNGSQDSCRGFGGANPDISVERQLQGKGQLRDLRRNKNLDDVNIDELLKKTPRELQQLQRSGGITQRTLKQIQKAFEGRDLGKRGKNK